MTLKDYQEIVGAVAAVVTIGQCFSPIFICKQIISQGNTQNVDSTPFVGGIGLGLLFLRHGYLLDDSAMVSVNVCALFLNAMYLLLYLIYTDNRSNLISNFLKAVIGASLIIFYSLADRNADRVLNVYGTLVTGLMFALIAAPLRDLKEIIKNRDTGSMPFPMILSGTVVTALWLLYGIILENVFIIAQNLVGFTLSAFQLSLFVIYPSKRESKKID